MNNNSLKLIKRMCLILFLPLIGRTLNKIFRMKYKTHAFGIEFEIEKKIEK